MRRVGLIGIGLVGTAAAERLLAAGLAVIGFDVAEERRAALRALGGEAADEMRAVAACERILLSLPTSAIAGAVLDELRPVLRPGTLLIDTTTGAPEDAVRFAEQARTAGAEYVDATVGGSSRQVRAGEAILICGGSEDAFRRCADLFAVLGRRAFHVGPAGSGARMKLVLNLVLGLNRAVLAEGLEFARSSGIDPALALEVLESGPAYSRAMETKGPKMLAGSFEPEARLSQHLKDVRLILAAGARQGARLPLSTLHAELLAEVEAAGGGGLDNSAIIQAFQTNSSDS